MTVHMFRCFIGCGGMSVSDLETRINDWIASNAEWTDDAASHSLSKRNTQPDGSGETYYAIDIRFEQTDTMSNLLQKFEDKLKDKVAWYRVGYHNCSHDESNGGPCSWDDRTEWTAKDQSVPSGVPDVTP